MCWFYDGNTQTLTEIGFMEKPGIEPASPGLQGKESFCGFPGNKPVLPGWFKICVCFITGTPKGSPKVVLLRRRNRTCDPGLQGKKTFCGFPGYKPVQLVCDLCVGFMRDHPKAQQKWFCGEAVNQTCDRWFTRHRLGPYSTTAPIKMFAAFMGINQFCSVGLRFVCWFYDGTSQRLADCGFMEKPGIEPVNPGLQGKKTFCGFPG